jgi:hypothetical protein
MQKSDYSLEPDGRFLVHDYNRKKPFSNFLPGIAGVFGRPMWVFYVNRGQGVVSFGTRNKDNAILEFFPANKAYQAVTTLGFRTFLKFNSARGPLGYEPFREPAESSSAVAQTFEVTSHELLIEEINRSLGLKISVRYFTVPGEPLAALAREVVLTNLASRALSLEILDGLPAVNPYGMNEFFIKQMSRTIEAWMAAENIRPKKAPFFRLKVDATDRPEVQLIEAGNFYFSMESGPRKPRLLDPIVDPAVVFGSLLDFSRPKLFYGTDFSKGFARQVTENKTPSAFSHAALQIPPGKSKTIRSVYGHAANVDTLNRYVSRALKPGYWESKREENKRLMDGIKSRLFTVTASEAYDLYCGQTFLDNVLRGGLPLRLGDKKRGQIFYVYSRKHGDLERDYNRFLLEPTYFSQGDGNYRDVNQNRRNDTWFDPGVGDINVKNFLNLVQLDGFNPLVIRGTLFRFVRSSRSAKVLTSVLGRKSSRICERFMTQKSFSPGELYDFLEESLKVSPALFQRLLSELSPFLVREERAEHGEGFWTDHWTYNLDLIESYLAIYPERLRELLFGQREFTFYDNDHRVRSRDEKYRLRTGGEVRQYGAVVADKEKKKLIDSRDFQPQLVRIRHGRGDVYKTTLFVKLLSLFTNKLASLDPEGVGIEMEADKPSWYDALNGLPGLLGSSLPETFELKRLAVFVLQALEDLEIDLNEEIAVPEEIAQFVKKVAAGLDRHLTATFEFWDWASSAKEAFREQTFFGISGKEKRLPFYEIKSFLERGREKIDIGLEKAYDDKGKIFPTYFQSHVFRYERRKDSDAVRPRQFRRIALPLFLEGPVHAMKVEKDPLRRRALLKAVRSSALYDAKLGMYKVNAPLAGVSLEAGRACVFSPGWLENESVWLHMEYKFLLEVLRSGMAEEFFKDFKKTLVPFQPYERYGRSPLENSSFIVSSVFSDSSLHGTGFVARLSGSTAEFLSLWLFMNIGKRPFILGPDKKVSLRFEPTLPDFLFLNSPAVRAYRDPKGGEKKVTVPKDGLAFLFLGKTLVVYHNPRRLNTFGNPRVSVKKITLRTPKGDPIEFKGDTVPSPYALKVRDEWVPRLDIELG